MGIRKLKRFVDENIKQNIQPSIFSPNSKLLIDGNGFVFYILNTYKGFSRNHEMKAVERRYGGDYIEIDKRVREEISVILHSQIVPVVYWDGKKRRMKLETDLRRRALIEDADTKLFEHCVDGMVYDESAYPLPTLAKYQIQLTFKELGVEQVFCEEEADQSLAERSAKSFAVRDAGNFSSTCGNSSENIRQNFVGENECVVYGNDSDFYLFKSTRYVVFGSLAEKHILRPANVTYGTRKTLHAVVYTRKIIAEHLDMSESSLIDFCLYLGNDYTSSFSKDLFLFETEEETVNELLESHDMHSVARTFSAYDDDRLDCNTADCNLNQAISFSRALYELESLDIFPFDTSGNGKYYLNSINAIDDALVLKCIDRVTKKIERDSNDAVASRKNTAAPVIDIVIEIIRYMCKIPRQNEMEQVYKLKMTTEQERALKYFAAKISQAENIVFNGVNASTDKISPLVHENIDSFDGELEYHNVQFHTIYMQLCRKVAKFLIDNGVPTTGMNPMYWYHGKTFHMLASKRFCMATHLYIRSKETIAQSTKSMKSKPNDHDHVHHSRDNSLSTSYANTLPIDKHREIICARIRANRVTIIHGETGCGKSSRIPQMIINDLGLANVKMFISQPRRIAATSLRSRVSNEIKDTMLKKEKCNYTSEIISNVDSIVGLRMGHGVKTVDTKATRIWFCTAGYLVLLAAHHPEVFKDHTHLVIDEIHERSVDTDLLCYIAKDLMQQHPHLKLILMSATLAADTYCEYFGIHLPALFVGSRRCPLKEYYLSDLLHKKSKVQLSSTLEKSVKKLIEKFVKHSSLMGLSSSNISAITESQCRIAFHLSRVVGIPGRSVLIFVDGINAIYNIVNLFEQLQNRESTKQYLVIPIHSNIPHEEQMTAFEINHHVVKIVVATNSAESSITLPDCDNVICLGTEKRIEYNAAKHQVCLVPAWISKASATQRAGRTARVRPGTVWRMYTKEIHGMFDAFDPPEILQTPLDHIILRLKAMLNRPIVSVLENVITAPDTSQFQPAFDSLYRLSFFSKPSDEGDLTTEGTLAATLGLDLNLCKLIIYGIRLGVGREAACVAAALSLERSPFRVASHFIHSHEEMNAIITKTLLAQLDFDDGHYSIPIMLLRILIWYRKHANCPLHFYGLVRSRMKTFDNTAKFLEARVNTFTRSNKPVTDPSEDSYVANALRLALFWVFNNQIVKSTSKIIEDQSSNQTEVQLKGSPNIQKVHILNVLQGNFAESFHIKDVCSRHLTVQHSLSEITSDIDSKIQTLLFSSFTRDIKIRWVRDIQDKSGAAYLRKDWIDSGNPNAKRIKELVSKLFLSSGVIKEVPLDDGRIQFYFFHTIGNNLISDNKSGKFKYLRTVSPNFLEICVEKTRSKLLHHVNIKGCKDIKKVYLQNLFPKSQKISNSSTNGSIRTIVFHDDTGVKSTSTSMAKKKAIINDLPAALRILVNIQSRTHNRKKVIYATNKEITDETNQVETSLEALPFELVGDVSAEWTFESTEWVKDVLTRHEQKPLVGNLSFISVALNHCLKCKDGKRGNPERKESMMRYYEGDVVRGVCASALVIGRNMSTVVVDNITLLPPGGGWINRAYRCIMEKETLNQSFGVGDQAHTDKIVMKILKCNRDTAVVDSSLKEYVIKLFPEFMGSWQPNVEENKEKVIIDTENSTRNNSVKERLEQGEDVKLERMEVSANLLHQRIVTLERISHKSNMTVNILSDLKENLSFLQRKIESAREQADVQTISNVEYSKGVDALTQSNSDSDEEEILLTASIPVKTRKVL